MSPERARKEGKITMKRFKTIMAFVLAVVMTLAMSSVAVFAAGTGTITITMPTNPAPTEAVTYTAYKVFDADASADGTKISYKIISGKASSITATDGLSKFEADAAGNVYYYTRTSDTAEWTKVTDTSGLELSKGMVDAIGEYVKNDTAAGTGTGAVGAGTATITGLPNGYYYVTTTTGSVVTIDSTNPNASVEDKNTLSTVVKSAGTEYSASALAAIAAVGTNQDFTAQITVGEGTTKLEFVDTMTNLEFVTGSLSITKKSGDTTTNLVSGTDYTLTPSTTGFTVVFNKVGELKKGDVLTLNYKGKVTSDALSVNPAKNTATIKTNNYENTTPEVKVYNAKFTVTKKDGNGAALPGAGFVIKNSEDKYYTLANGVITWVDSIDDADEHVSDAQGAVPAFMGLGVGEYTLVEKTIPAGYNKADDVDFEIEAGDYTTDNLEQTANVVNNAGAELPTTGGIGTTIFYVLGSLLVIGCGIVLVSRKRMQNNK